MKEMMKVSLSDVKEMMKVSPLVHQRVLEMAAMSVYR